MTDAGEHDEGVGPGDVIIVGIEEPVAVPAHAAEDAQGEEREHGCQI